MKIYAIADLHLSFCQAVDPTDWERVKVYKPMDIFSAQWQKHYQKIYENWIKTVHKDDLVLVPGDISWGMTLDEAAYDLAFLGELPGKIIMVQGNHDYWWKSVSQVRERLPGNISVLQNDSISLGDTVICGSRGWNCPNSGVFSDKDKKIYQRELQRLELSLKSASAEAKDIIVMMHFMPVNEHHEISGFIEIMEKYPVRAVVYGHLHSGARRLRLPEKAWNMEFYLVSADYLNFTPYLIRDQLLS